MRGTSGITSARAGYDHAPDIAGKGIANPTALMQSAALMLAHLGEHASARKLQRAVESVYADAKRLTPDVGVNHICATCQHSR